MVEARSGCEANGEGKAGVEVHMDGEEHWDCIGPDDTWPWHHPSQPLLLLAQERCLGGAQGLTRDQALDLPETDDYSPQSSH